MLALFTKLLLFYLVYPSSAYKILVFYSVPVPSVMSLGAATTKHLLNAGHEVTFVTSYPGKYKFNNKNYHEVDISNVLSIMEGNDLLNFTNLILNKDDVIKETMADFNDIALALGQLVMESPKMKELLTDQSQHFDVVIADYYENELYAGIAALYKCPIIWSYSMSPHWNILRLVGAEPNPNYATDYYTVNLPPYISAQRLQQLWIQIQWHWRKWWFVDDKLETMFTAIYKPHFEKRGRQLPAYKDLRDDVALVLCNDHMALGEVPALPLNFKLIGGFHIDKTNPLPEDLQALMDSSQNGVIYFSMGSTWQSKDMPKSIVDGLLKMFGNLKQTVLWKFEASIPSVPKNVHLIKWAPQSSILAHKKCLLFITHGGHLSSIEAVFFGVPVISIPIYVDQFMNAQKSVVNGIGLKVELNFNLASNLEKAIKKMLDDDSYRNKIQELSVIYHDQPTSPSAQLVHWTEHIIKTKGGHHLRSPSRHFTWIQLMYLDFIMSWVGVFLFLLTLLSILWKIKNKNVKKTKRS